MSLSCRPYLFNSLVKESSEEFFVEAPLLVDIFEVVVDFNLFDDGWRSFLLDVLVR